MKKRNWIVHVDGYKPFPMVVLDRELSHAEAVVEARGIWPKAEVE